MKWHRETYLWELRLKSTMCHRALCQEYNRASSVVGCAIGRPLTLPAKREKSLVEKVKDAAGKGMGVSWLQLMRKAGTLYLKAFVTRWNKISSLHVLFHISKFYTSYCYILLLKNMKYEWHIFRRNNKETSTKDAICQRKVCSGMVLETSNLPPTAGTAQTRTDGYDTVKCSQPDCCFQLFSGGWAGRGCAGDESQTTKHLECRWDRLLFKERGEKPTQKDTYVQGIDQCASLYQRMRG